MSKRSQMQSLCFVLILLTVGCPEPPISGKYADLALLIRAFLPIRGSEMPAHLIKRRKRLLGDE